MSRQDDEVVFPGGSSMVLRTGVVLAFVVTTHASGAEPSRIQSASWQPIESAVFIPNHGQWDAGTRALARFGDLSVRIEREAISFFGLGGTSDGPGASVIRFSFIGANPDASARGESPHTAPYNFFVGNDPNRWATEVPGYRRLVVENLYPGLDLVAGSEHGSFTYDFVLTPGADARQVRVEIEGAESLRIDELGSLIVATAFGELRQSPPRAYYQDEVGVRESSPSRCRSAGRMAFEFDLDADPHRSRVLDPGIRWSTALGGLIPAGTSPYVYLNNPNAVTAFANGDILVVGATGRLDFPTTPGVYGEDYFGGWADAFLSRLSSDGKSLMTSTFLGGVNNVDMARSVVLGTDDDVVITGLTSSTDYPQTPGAYDSGGYIPGGHPIITRLDSTLSVLEYSVHIETTASGWVHDAVLKPNGDVVITGETWGTFPTTPGAFDSETPPQVPNHLDAFVLCLDASGSALVFSTRLGADASQSLGRCVALAPNGNVVCGGFTNAPHFPITPGVIDPSFTGAIPEPPRKEGFVTMFDPTGSSLVFSTFFGGSDDDDVQRIAVGADGCPVITGETRSTELPTTPGSFQPACKVGNGCFDVFVSKLTPDGKGLIASTFFGGGDHEWVHHMHLDSSGAVTITGETWSDGGNFPTTVGAFEEVYYSTFKQMYVGRLTPNLRGLAYSTTFGTDLTDGTNATSRMGLAVAMDGSATVAGRAGSAAYPTTPEAFDPVFHPFKCFVTQFDMLPKGVTRFGGANPGCEGSPSIEVIDSPTIGSAAFAITSAHASPGAMGFLGASFQAARSPISAGPVSILLDPTSLALVPVNADASGYVALPVLIRPGSSLANHAFFAQFYWSDSCASGGFTASHALRIEAQL